MFENKEVSKSYFAITAGEMPDSGTIETPVDHKEALTQFTIIKKIASEKYQSLNLVALDPKTGRRHQLRKHLALLGHPILGDQEYGMNALSNQAKGLHLHSFSLRFTHPFTAKDIYLEASVPKKFKKLFPVE